MNPRYRRWLFAAGMLLTLVSVGYLALYAFENWRRMPPLVLTAGGAGWLAVACALYFASLLTTSAAWLNGIRTFGSAMAAGPAFGVALTAQIGKYVPGNVAHHVGRAALGADRGLPLRVTAQSSVMEIGAAVLASGLIAAAALPSVPAFALPHGRTVIGAIALVLLAGAGGAVFLFWRSAASGARFLTGGAKMLGCYGLSFLFAGASYYAVARGLGQTPAPGLCVAAYAIAWVVGFVTPGAPAGLGVRETILVVALTPSVGPAAISIAIAHRLATAVTDAVAAGLGALILSMPEKVVAQ